MQYRSRIDYQTNINSASHLRRQGINNMLSWSTVVVRARVGLRSAQEVRLRFPHGTLHIHQQQITPYHPPPTPFDMIVLLAVLYFVFVGGRDRIPPCSPFPKLTYFMPHVFPAFRLTIAYWLTQEMFIKKILKFL